MSNKARQQRLNNKARKANTKNKQVQPVSKRAVPSNTRLNSKRNVNDLMARLDRLSPHYREEQEMGVRLMNRLFGADIRL